MWNFIEQCKTGKKYKSLLQPIEYYSSKYKVKIPNRPSKITEDGIKKCLLPVLEEIYFVLKPNVSENKNLIKYLLENQPEANQKNNTKLKYKNLSCLYYCGQISQSKEVALLEYAKCGFQQNEDYYFIISCLIKLQNELNYPNTDTGFEDFPEHLLATYNILCYYYMARKNIKNIDIICVSLYQIAQEYLRAKDENFQTSKNS